jgi:hypothetical protein
MKVFQTENGSRYTLRVISKGSNLNYGGAVLFFPTVYVNPDPTITTTEPYIIVLNTNKRIIPVQCNFGLLDSATPVVGISSCLYNYRTLPLGLTPNNAQAIRAMGKTFPYVRENFYTSNNFYSHFVDYNNLVFTDADFIEPQAANFNFTPFIPGAVVNSLAPFLSTYGGTIPASVIDSLISFTYFEML